MFSIFMIQTAFTETKLSCANIKKNKAIMQIKLFDAKIMMFWFLEITEVCVD